MSTRIAQLISQKDVSCQFSVRADRFAFRLDGEHISVLVPCLSVPLNKEIQKMQIGLDKKTECSAMGKALSFYEQFQNDHMTELSSRTQQ